MIAVEKSKSGRAVVKKDGRWLSSSYDPVKEAMSWARQVPSDCDFVFLLGIGSGYHVAEFIRTRAPESYLIIESDADCVRAALEIHDCIPADRVLTVANPADLVEEDRFRDVLTTVYSFAKYAPSCQLAPEFFSGVESLLIGRDQISFLLQLKARPGIWACLDADRVQELGAGERSINIKTLQNLFNRQSSRHRERQIWRALEELVK